MIQVGIAWEPFKTTDWSTGCLVLNGQLIEDSRAYQHNDMLSVSVHDTTAVTLLMQCRLAKIAEYFDKLTLPLPEAPSECFEEIEIVCKDYDGSEFLRLDFDFYTDLERWAKPWSIADFASTLKRVVEDRNVPGLSYYHREGDSILDGMHLIVELHTPDETVQQALGHWLPIVRDVCEEVDAFLAASARKGALVALFQFPPEVRTACEQYLVYFGQFLQDLGIRATTELKEQACGILFTVTPESGPEALERIQEALDLYLRMPESPDFDAEATRHTDVAVQQYAANVYHLRSQLALAQALLETKNATIESLQAANLHYKQLLGTNAQSQGQLASASAGETQGDEPTLGGAITITPYVGKGFQLNLPFILRKLRRTLKGEG